MKLDLTITISVILALCSILSNLLTAIINNIYQYKLKKIEYIDNKKCIVLQNFIDAATKCSTLENWREDKNLKKALYSLPLYFKSGLDCIEIADKFSKTSKEQYKYKIFFETIVIRLSKEIQKH